MHARSFPALLVVAALLAPAVAAARVVRVTCRDGVVPPLPRCKAGCTRPLRCDADGQCNGVCTFAIRVCGEVVCVDRIFPVPVGQRQKITLARALGAKPTRFVLRCLPHPRGVACPTSTTTTSTTTTSTTTSTTLLCHFDGATNSCQGGCPQAGTCVLVAPDQCDCPLPGCHTCWVTVNDFCTDMPCSSEADCREPNTLCLADKCVVPCPMTTTTTMPSAMCVPTGVGVPCDPTSSLCCPVPNASVFCGGNPTTCRLSVCNPGYANCNMEAADGCEVSLDTDSYNCGGCDHICPTGTSCAARSCR